MRRLWVANCNSEYMVDRLDLLDSRELEVTPVVAARMVWLLRDGDAMVMAQPLDPAFVARVGALMGFDAQKIDLITPGDAGVQVLDQEVLHRPALVGRLKELVAEPGEWEIRGYLSDRGVDALARALGLGQGAVSGFDAAGGAELFNSKAVFRALAAALGVPVPDGAVCSTRGDLGRALERLTTSTGAVIVKADRCGGGAGNLLCRVDPGIPMSGTLAVQPLTGAQDRAAILAHTGLAATHAPQGQVVVEVYHPGCRSVCLEVDCPDPGDGPPRLLSFGEMLMEPAINGFVMPAQDLPAGVRQEVSDQALRLAAGMRDFGYRGLVNIDAIVSPHSQVWFNEVNARLGGGTHLHHLAAHLLGPDWDHHHVLISRDDLPAAGIPQLLSALDDHHLAFDPATGTGVVITGDDTLNRGTAEYAVLAPDLQAARHLETRLRSLTPAAAAGSMP
ncbi:peptide ligase PGM1-related protein [Streptomyces cyaneofuscatus]|uniref:preATP grasp domain-containing protein n=1 Tax=Streptomyces cyaneofuscatus TaxID=66883 RepID=UPI0037AED741